MAIFQRPLPTRYWNLSVEKADAGSASRAASEKLTVANLLGLGGFPASHPLCLGMMGMHGEAFVNTAIQEADLLLAFGMRFDDRVTGKLATYAQHSKKIHVEIDPSEIGKNVPVDVGIVGDLRNVLEALLPHVPSKRHEAWRTRIQTGQNERSAAPISAPMATSAPQAGISNEINARDSPKASKRTMGAAQA